MKSWTKIIPLVFVVALVIAGFAGLNQESSAKTPEKQSKYLSPATVIVSPSTNELYIAEFTANQVAVFDLATKKVSKRYKLNSRPTGLAASPDGKFLYVTSESIPGCVYKINTKTGKLTTFKTAHHTFAPSVSKNGKTLYICNRFKNKISAIDTATGKTIGTAKAVREPIVTALTEAGDQLIVGNHLPTQPPTSGLAAACVQIFDPADLKQIAKITLPNGSNSVSGIAVSKDGKYAYITHILARYQIPTNMLTRGWMNTSALTIVDLKAKKIYATVLLDNVDRGAANPWAVAITKDQSEIVVTLAGTHEIEVINRVALHKKLAKLASGQAVTNVSKKLEDTSQDLSFLVGMRKRIKLGGYVPRGLAIVGKTAYATEYFSDAISAVDISNLEYPKLKTYQLGPKQAMDKVRKGELYFHNADQCFQQWQSCSSCHPDARTDGLNWDLLNDGVGNPKSTKSMLYSHFTAPVMITGIRAKAEVAVEAGFKHIQFLEAPKEVQECVNAYLRSLRPIPSPYLVNGKLSAAAKRGEKVFLKAGCLNCHVGKYLTNCKKFDVGIADGRHKGDKFDTPTLVEVWRTAPYLYDGRATSILDMITNHNKKNMHGDTKNLTKQELSDLAEYILSK